MVVWKNMLLTSRRFVTNWWSVFCQDIREMFRCLSPKRRWLHTLFRLRLKWHSNFFRIKNSMSEVHYPRRATAFISRNGVFTSRFIFRLAFLQTQLFPMWSDFTFRANTKIVAWNTYTTIDDDSSHVFIMSIFYVDKLLQSPIYSLFITQLLVVGYPKEIREKTWSKSNNNNNNNNNKNKNNKNNNNNNNKNNNNWQQKRRCTIAVRKLHAPGNEFLLISLTVKRELLANPTKKSGFRFQYANQRNPFWFMRCCLCLIVSKIKVLWVILTMSSRVTAAGCKMESSGKL